MCNDKDKIPLIVVVGPTASGKTKLAVELAKKYDGEVVSADSMQIYKGLNIATAKPTVDEMQGIPHHLIDFLEPDTPFSVADYVKLAKEKIFDIYRRNKLPILCGGTGLYVSSLINNINFDETQNDYKIRQRLENEAKEFGNHYLWEKLNQIDPETASKVHENNLPRVIRGIEVFELTGKKLSDHKIDSRREESPFNCCIIGIGYSDREVLYNRINKRVDEMIDQGLIDEVKFVYKNLNLSTAHQAIGYKELIPYLENVCDLELCIEKIKQETRHYAKRQLTWFRKIDKINWIYADNFEEYKYFINNVENVIAKSGII